MCVCVCGVSVDGWAARSNRRRCWIHFSRNKIHFMDRIKTQFNIFHLCKHLRWNIAKFVFCESYRIPDRRMAHSLRMNTTVIVPFRCYFFRETKNIHACIQIIQIKMKILNRAPKCIWTRSSCFRAWGELTRRPVRPYVNNRIRNNVI